MDQGFWRERNVLVTGCSGLLGGWLSASLAGAGANVVGLIRDDDPRSRLHREGIGERMTLVRGDVADLEPVTRAVNEHEIATIFHLAAQTIVATANRSPISTLRSNIEGTWNVLEAARLIGSVEQLVMASSDKAYGAQERLPYTEDAPLEGRHPYDASKSCGDLLSLAYHHTYGLPASIVRCGNLYGGGDLNFNRLVPGTIRSALRDKRPVIRSDGRYTRDYVYVEDAVEAYVALAEGMARSGQLTGEAFNFSNDRPVTVIELTRRILELMDRSDLEPVILNEASNEIRDQFLSCQKAREHLGWAPRFGLDEGLLLTIEWYRDLLVNDG